MKKPLGINLILIINIIKITIALSVSVAVSYIAFTPESNSVREGFMSAVDTELDTMEMGRMAGAMIAAILPNIILFIALLKRKYILTLLMIFLTVFVSSSTLNLIFFFIMIAIVLFDKKSKMYLRGEI